jgi:DNA-binding GntR family transcriptional regulator
MEHLSRARPAPALETGLKGVSLTLDRRVPMTEQVHGALRAAILSAQLPPGMAISENAICRQFAVSRTPVRAAILRLSEEGLVDVFPQQGSFVSQIRIGGVRDSHFVRRTLELALIRTAAARWTPAASLALRATATAQRDSIARGDTDAFHREDERFHQIIAVEAGHAGVWPTILAAKTQLTRLIRFSGDAQRLPVVVEEHLRIADALEAGAPEAAAAALGAHLDQIFILFEGLPDDERRQFEP